ncbi:hypothetical protein PR202_gb14887 [Eleusine coracana subsp. coracana]|uniref:DUS-like FMN-binding domain-containing protein n=1 Tax=Eleusine coracana subsp. coracana TaxID=191504 RepID=A0AAV5EXG0_ELECO|nr:hypothetical protein PR202_gb14887 [Eleusine coracana subsp. coracana]
MDYRDKLVLAPMGTLPFRMLAAEYGADITYGEEIIDHKFLKCKRVTNESLGTTDFLEKGTDSVVFRTCPEERGRVVFQMGTSNAVRALKAAEIVIANGDIFEYEDFRRIKDATGAASVMVARGAMWNASIFSTKGKIPWEDVKREYVRKSILWDNDIKSTKHTLKEMIMHHSCLELPEGKAVIKCDTSADIA